MIGKRKNHRCYGGERPGAHREGGKIARSASKALNSGASRLYREAEERPVLFFCCARLRGSSAGERGVEGSGG